ncbi:MAG: hypothetical protein JSR60_08165 [Proteobacteria bacterium]|nr:hypothetical protein [Pseudomonadota bacterium]
MTHRQPFWRIVALQLALVAMTLQAALPAGWMPGKTPGTLVVCTLTDGSAHHPSGTPGKSEHHAVCPFAAVAHAAPPATPHAVAVSFATIAAIRPPHQRTGRPLASYLAAEARAPPATLI